MGKGQDSKKAIKKAPAKTKKENWVISKDVIANSLL